MPDLIAAGHRAAASRSARSRSRTTGSTSASASSCAAPGRGCLAMSLARRRRSWSPGPTASSAATSSSGSSREGARRPRVLPLQLARLGGLARRGRPRRSGGARRPPRRHPRRALRRAGDRRDRGRLPPRGADRDPVLVRRAESFIDTNVSGTLQRPRGGRPGRRPARHPDLDERGLRHARDLPIRETHPLSAQSPYAATKVAADQLALAFHRSFEPAGRRPPAVQHVRPAPVGARGPADDAPPAPRGAARDPARAARPAARPDVRRRHGRRLRPGRRGRRDRRPDDPARDRAERDRSASCSSSRAGCSGCDATAVEDPARLRPDASEVLVLQSDPSLRARAPRLGGDDDASRTAWRRRSSGCATPARAGGRWTDRVQL